ncbi:multiple sugar transport system substrate-binding protein [Kribbella antiqua]|uniref:Multiple sugar transport system substrate-binding protein n=1 Tax=Kribbella antiqua TaxID=2512217 RepID=A0A4V2S2S5_9ACTN|nr:sugar ABC transporter substrate-binding protein [Kribbella antiqua]TCO41600.1 multiple sugar transport system substrate-binding protein [Kribbella antiqua]
MSHRPRMMFASLAAAATAAALLLSACGPGPAEKAQGEVRLQMVESLTNPTRTALLKKLIADFEAKNSGIKVQLISPPTNQADQKIQQMLQSGKGVDVLEVRDTTVGPFSTNKWIYDMAPDLKGWDGLDALTPNALKVTQQGGHSYMVPYGFYGLSLFYRKDLVQQAGFSGPPKSWSELVEQAKKINNPKKNVYGYSFRGGLGAGGNAIAVISGYVIDDINKDNAFKLTDGKTIFSSPKAVDALNLYLDLFKNAAPPSSVSWGYPEMVQGFTSGTTGFLLQDPEVIATVKQSKTIKEDQWGTAPLPVGPTGKAAQPLANAGWGVAAGSEHKKEAVELVKFLTSGDAAMTFSKENSLVPILKSAADDPFFKDGPWASYVAMNQSPDTYIVVTQPRGVAWSTEWGNKSDADVQKLITGKAQPAEILKSWDEFWTAKWAGK